MVMVMVQATKSKWTLVLSAPLPEGGKDQPSALRHANTNPAPLITPCIVAVVLPSSFTLKGFGNSLCVSYRLNAFEAQECDTVTPRLI
jgi:hypothetical protein